MEIITKEIIEKAYKIYRSGNSIKATTKLINEKYNIGVYPAAICKRLNNSGFTLRSSKEGTILEKRKHIDISKLLENYRDNRQRHTEILVSRIILGFAKFRLPDSTLQFREQMGERLRVVPHMGTCPRAGAGFVAAAFPTPYPAVRLS